MNKFLLIGIISLILFGCGDTTNNYIMAAVDDSSSSEINSSDSSSSLEFTESSSSTGTVFSSSGTAKSSSSVASSSSDTVNSSSSGTVSSSSAASSSSAVCSSSSVSSSSSASLTGTSGSITDSRDGKTYKWVAIGSQKWFTENLMYNPDGKYDEYCGDRTINGYTIPVCKYSHDSINVPTDTIVNDVEIITADICPVGWHVPSVEDYKVLLASIGETLDTVGVDSVGNFIDVDDPLSKTTWYVSDSAGYKLKADSVWTKPGSDAYGFNALPNTTDGISGSISLSDDYYVNIVNSGLITRLRKPDNYLPVRCVADN